VAKAAAARLIKAAEDDDPTAALIAVKVHRLGFWDAMLSAAAQRAGVRHWPHERVG
jgi:predicted nucleic acid-binding protein